MRTSRFFVDQQLIADSEIVIEGEQAHYIRNVLRLKAEDPLIVFDGKAGEYPASIVKVEKDAVSIKTGEFNPDDRTSPLSITLGIAVIKRDAMDLAIQKAVELGVTSIQPLMTSRTNVAEKSLKKRLPHWQRISISACEQCGLNVLPIVHEVQPLAQWIESTDGPGLMAAPGATQMFTNISPPAGSTIRLLIGPEGGLTDTEQASAYEKGFSGINLGPRILRAETAAITMLSLAQALLAPPV